MRKKHLIIIRGISGSGKTTLANSLVEKYHPNVYHFEADSYFMLNGVYTFVPSCLKSAHEACKNKMEWVLNGDPETKMNVIVSNTFTTKKEILGYLVSLDIQKHKDLKITVMEPSTEWKNNPAVCTEKNVHNVPKVSVERQHARWEHIEPGEYTLETLLKELISNVAT